MFAALYSAAVDGAPALMACAQGFSPRIEVQMGGRLVLIDVAGLGRIVGDAHAVAGELRAGVSRALGPSHPSPVAGRQSDVTVVVAPSRIAALLLAVAGHDIVVLPGRTATALGALSLSVFGTLASLNQRNPRNQNAWNQKNLKNDRNEGNRRNRACALCTLTNTPRLCGRPGGACTELVTLGRWGLSTLGDLAALPAAELSARLGHAGVVLQRLARGLDTQPLVPVIEEARFEASIDLEWPIEDLQPLSFVLARLLDPLSAALERADRGAAAIATELTLVRLPADAARTHVRRLELPAPMRDARVLRTLILLDLESHPPAAGIDRVTIRIEPTPGRIVQFSLLERAGPQPETIATLASRLTALMGEGRVGAPVLLDSHAPDAFTLQPFSGELPAAVGGRERKRPGGTDLQTPPEPSGGACLRRFRLPVAARVVMAGDRPARVTTDRIGIKGGDVRQFAGPWRASGHWWRTPDVTPAAWDRDEYDIALADGAAYRIFRDRHEDKWFMEGILD